MKVGHPWINMVHLWRCPGRRLEMSHTHHWSWYRFHAKPTGHFVRRHRIIDIYWRLVIEICWKNSHFRTWIYGYKYWLCNLNHSRFYSVSCGGVNCRFHQLLKICMGKAMTCIQNKNLKTDVSHKRPYLTYKIKITQFLIFF